MLNKAVWIQNLVFSWCYSVVSLPWSVIRTSASLRSYLPAAEISTPVSFTPRNRVFLFKRWEIRNKQFQVLKWWFFWRYSALRGCPERLRAELPPVCILSSLANVNYLADNRHHRKTGTKDQHRFLRLPGASVRRIESPQPLIRQERKKKTGAVYSGALKETRGTVTGEPQVGWYRFVKAFQHDSPQCDGDREAFIVEGWCSLRWNGEGKLGFSK